MPAMGSLELAQFFDQEEGSNITICFGDRKIPCHKIILMGSSPYLKRLLDSKSPFMESGKKEIELKEDDPVALEALLRYFYRFDYEDAATRQARKGDWEDHLEIYKVARKYQVPKLEEKAVVIIVRIITAIKEIKDISTVIQKMRLLDIPMLAIADALEGSYLAELLDEPSYREYIQCDPDVMLKHLDHFRAQVQDSESKQPELVKKEKIWCRCECVHYRAEGEPMPRCDICAGPARYLGETGHGKLLSGVWFWVEKDQQYLP